MSQCPTPAPFLVGSGVVWEIQTMPILSTPAELGRLRITPPQLARLWGIDVLKVLKWIRSGELPCIDAGTHRGQKKPRYLISQGDIDAFEAGRATGPQAKAIRHRRHKDPSVTQYF